MCGAMPRPISENTASRTSEECFDRYAEHIQLLREEDAQFTPKHHLLWHLLLGMRDLGNPATYACWMDEALNKTLKASCRQTSQATFESTVLLRMRDLLQARVRKRRL